MKRFLLLASLSFSLFSIPLAAQTPTVTRVDPASGPSSGGTEVAITGTNLATKVQCFLPCPPRVVFGDVSVNVKFESETRLLVDTPPHPPGTVDLTVAIAGQDPVRVPNGFTFTADHDDAYEQILLPIYLDEPVHGAFGSVWRTDFWLRNDSYETVALAPWPCPPGQLCPPVYPLTKLLPGGESIHNLDPYFRPPGANPSRILYVSKPNVSTSLRVADISRAALNAGTDIPVIRGNAMRRGISQLFDVPLNANFRVLLRLYDVAYTHGSFAVRLYDQAKLGSGLAPVHVVTIPVSTSQTNDFRTEAAYGEFDVSNLLHLEKTWPAAVRIEIEPLFPGSRYWAFASITNNDSQLVTLSTPQ